MASILQRRKGHNVTQCHFGATPSEVWSFIFRRAVVHQKSSQICQGLVCFSLHLSLTSIQPSPQSGTKARLCNTMTLPSFWGSLGVCNFPGLDLQVGTRGLTGPWRTSGVPYSSWLVDLSLLFFFCFFFQSFVFKIFPSSHSQSASVGGGLSIKICWSVSCPSWEKACSWCIPASSWLSAERKNESKSSLALTVFSKC